MKRNKDDKHGGKPMPATGQQSVRSSHTDEEKVDRLLQEINLLNLERFLFTTDRKHAVAPGTKFEYTDSDGTFYKVTVGEYGQPGSLAYRVFHAALYELMESGKECTGDVCRLRHRILFSKRHLVRLCGRTWSGGSNDADYHRAILALNTTHVTMRWYDKKSGETKEANFTPFASAFFAKKSDAVTRTPSMKDFDRCYLSFAPDILESYEAGYVRAFNLARLLSLSCKGQMLYKRLFLAFGYLHQKGVKHPRYEKDYDALCEWLNQRPRRYYADIVRHIGGALDEIQAGGTIKRYEIVPKASGKGYKVVCEPGPAFYEDYALFLETASMHLPMRAPDLLESEPVELVAYFHEKLGRTHGEFRPKELEQAEDILKRLTFDEAQDLVDFTLEEKVEKVIPQVFGFVVGYLPQWQKVREARAAKREQRKKIAACPHCDAEGRLAFLYKDHTGAPREGRQASCPHNPDTIARWAAHYGYTVPSLHRRDAKNG